MSSIDITFALPADSKFRWLDGLDRLGEDEIEERILIHRGALSALSAELTDRREPWWGQSLEYCKNMLQKTARTINDQGLTPTHEKYLDCLTSFLIQAACAEAEEREGKTGKTTRQYLWLISRVIGWHYVLLIFCAQGKHKIEHLDEDQRIKLVIYIAQDQETLFCHRLQDKVIQCNFSKKCMNLD